MNYFPGMLSFYSCTQRKQEGAIDKKEAPTYYSILVNIWQSHVMRLNHDSPLITPMAFLVTQYSYNALLFLQSEITTAVAFLCGLFVQPFCVAFLCCGIR